MPPLLDRSLVGGATLFGIGWGAGGHLPGASLESHFSGQPMIMLFIAAMVAGILLVDRVLVPARSKARQPHTA